MPPVTVTKLSSTDAFYVVDLDGAPSAAGSVRCAKKILVDGAEALARRLTYAYASLGLQVSGASAGINVDGEGRDAAIAAFVEELQPAATEGTLLWSVAKGVGPGELDGLGPQPPTNTEDLFAAGVVACVRATRRSLDGARVALEDVGHGAPELAAAFESAGATVVAQGGDALAAEADVIGVGSKNGVIHHENVTGFAGRVIVPLAPLAVTTRALADGRRAEVMILPDFVTTAGSLVRGDTTPDAVAERIGSIVAEVVDHPDGVVLGACERAETFLLTWRDELPFGRPI
jgi:glutamate dehydrogenase/leucine dehydrogenase